MGKKTVSNQIQVEHNHENRCWLTTFRMMYGTREAKTIRHSNTSHTQREREKEKCKDLKVKIVQGLRENQTNESE